MLESAMKLGINHWISTIKDDFENKEIYYCMTSGVGGTRINIDATNITFCHESIINNVPSEVRNVCKGADFTIEKYFESIYRVLTLFQSEDFPCRKCDHCFKGRYNFEKIQYVVIATCRYCNNKCVYCNAHSDKKETLDNAYNPLFILEELYKYNAIGDECYYDWGGGEPTLNPYFDVVSNWIFQHGYKQRINTSAVNYSDSVYSFLKDNKANLRISVDSGTAEGYRRIKGTDNYIPVWENIKKYCSVSDEVYIKYNMFNLNSDKVEIEAFVCKCSEAGVKHILLDAEINSYQKDCNYGPFYFTQKEFEAIHYLEKLARNADISTDVSGYAFSVRPEKNEVGDLLLPSVYYDNIDKDTIKNGIMIKTTGYLEEMISTIKQKYTTTYVFGAGHIGNIVGKIMNLNQIDFVYLDNNPGCGILNGKKVLKASEVLNDDNNINSCIIVAIRDFKDVLRQINECKKQSDVFWVKEDTYIDYLRHYSP